MKVYILLLLKNVRKCDCFVLSKLGPFFIIFFDFIAKKVNNAEEEDENDEENDVNEDTTTEKEKNISEHNDENNNITGRWFWTKLGTAPSTVVLKRESKSWSKWPISDLVFYNIKIPPCFCPLGSSLLLTGALKWGTVQTSTSTDTGIMKGQN